MKAGYLFLLGGCLGSGSGWAQTLQGTFLTPEVERGFGGSYWRFEGRRFFYYRWGCTGSTQGIGTFRVVQRQLLLRFEHSPADTAVSVQPSLPTDPATTLRLRVLDRDAGTDLSEVTVVSRRYHLDSRTGDTGEAVLSYPAPVADTLLVEFIGYSSIQLPVRVGAGQRFTVRLGTDDYYPAGATLRLRTRKQTATELRLEELHEYDDPEQNAVERTHVCRLSPAQAAAFEVARKRR